MMDIVEVRIEIGERTTGHANRVVQATGSGGNLAGALWEVIRSLPDEHRDALVGEAMSLREEGL